MAHPYHAHRAHHASKARVKHIHHHASGGKVHSDAAEDRAMIKRAIGAHDKQLHGGKHTDLGVLGHKHGGRVDKFARGGHAKKHKGGNHVNIMIAPHGRPSVDPGDAAPAGVPPAITPGGGPPMPPPMAGPPGGMPPGPGGMPMKPPGMMKRGGGVKGHKYKGGAESGVGRLEKAKVYGLKPHKKKG